MSETIYAHHLQVHSDRLVQVSQDRPRRQLLAQARARRQLARAERQAARARLVLAATDQSYARRATRPLAAG